MCHTGAQMLIGSDLLDEFKFVRDGPGGVARVLANKYRFYGMASALCQEHFQAFSDGKSGLPTAKWQWQRPVATRCINWHWEWLWSWQWQWQ
jgi:hypothetical protein